MWSGLYFGQIHLCFWKLSEILFSVVTGDTKLSSSSLKEMTRAKLKFNTWNWGQFRFSRCQRFKMIAIRLLLMFCTLHLCTAKENEDLGKLTIIFTSFLCIVNKGWQVSWSEGRSYAENARAVSSLSRSTCQNKNPLKWQKWQKIWIKWSEIQLWCAGCAFKINSYIIARVFG